MTSTLLFLPGVSGNTEFWKPVANKLTYPGEKIHLGWPGFGQTPADPDVSGFNDLVETVFQKIVGPTALIAQSMGGVIAVLAALAKPELVTHLVLTVTSGGLDMQKFNAQDWRDAFFSANPSLPKWFGAYREDLTPQLSKIQIPTLLLWGDADPISPVPVGQELASRLPSAKLHVFSGGDHDVANVFSDKVADLIDAHLAAKRNNPPLPSRVPL